MKGRQSIFNTVVASLFAALIAVCVAWFFHIPVMLGSHSAYIHFGDAFIFLAAVLLPHPYAAAAAGIGGALGDLLCGAAHWAPFTLVIKVLLVFCFTGRGKKLLCKRNLFAALPVTLITVAGYYLAEALIAGNWVAPVVSIWGNLVQSVGSMIIFIPLAALLERLEIKSKLRP